MSKGSRKANPPAHIVIDPFSHKILFISRVKKGDWSGSSALKAAGDRAMKAAKTLGRNVITVVHPYVPKGFKQGVKVSPLFYSYGSVEWGPDGALHGNPLNRREAKMWMSEARTLQMQGARADRSGRSEEAARDYGRAAGVSQVVDSIGVQL